MRTHARFTVRAGLLAAALVAWGTALPAAPPQSSALVQEAIGDAEFWRLVSELSESSGTFPQQLMSNEDSAQLVIPEITAAIPAGGVYIGVGTEQNFTYAAALRPRLAFLVDIRRDNMLEVLMYKALFELSADRVELVSRLFALPRPERVPAALDASGLFALFAASQPDDALFERQVQAVLDNLTATHRFSLDETDRAAIRRMMTAFKTAGPSVLKGYGDRTNPTFADLMAATDSAGRQRSFLASDDYFAIVRDLHRRNLIVPVVGDFAGERALAGIASYLKSRDAVVDVFYVSNVERYLFEQGEHGKRFYANVTALPRNPASRFIRSATRDISQRLGIPIARPDLKWQTFVFSIQQCLDALSDGRIQTYRELFTVAN